MFYYLLNYFIHIHIYYNLHNKYTLLLKIFKINIFINVIIITDKLTLIDFPVRINIINNYKVILEYFKTPESISPYSRHITCHSRIESETPIVIYNTSI